MRSTPIEELENTDLFKFSPFKTLTPDQYETIEAIYRRLEQEHEDIKHGGPKKERVTVVNARREQAKQSSPSVSCSKSKMSRTFPVCGSAS